MADGMEALFPEDPGATYGSLLPLKRNADGSLSLAWPGAVHDVVNQGYNALVAPGEILTGRTPTGAPAHPDPYQAAQDITSTMMGLGLGSPVPAGSSRIFGGLAARTADQKAFNTAIDLHQKGASPEEIWNRTGWFKDVDDRWKFEIPDTGAQLKTENMLEIPTGSGMQLGPWRRGSTLGDILHHPELYAAYPELKNTPIRAVDDPSIKGGYSRDTGTISLGMNPDPRDILSTTLHETQHGVQSREGFAVGGSPGEFLPQGQKQWEEDWRGALDELAKHRKNAVTKGYDPRDMEESLGKLVMDRELTPEEEEKVAGLAKKHPELATNWVDALADAHILHGQHQAAFNAYSQLAGEVEARNVQERWAQGLGPETPPWMTQGYPSGKQTVRFYEPEPVSHNPFTHFIEPVEHNPFTHSAKPAEGNPFEPPSLVVAMKNPDGSVTYGKPGQIHADLLPEEEKPFFTGLGAEADTTQLGHMGFAAPGGKFMTRSEAANFLKQHNKPLAKKMGNPPELEMGSYLEAGGK